MNNIGVIYDIEDDKAVVLTRNSNFIMISRRADMFLGQQVTFDDKDIYRSKKSIQRFVAMSASIAAIFALIFMFFRFEPADTSAFGYVSLDINPSIEFSIDKDYKVLNAVALNADAAKLIDAVEIKNKTIESVIIEILKQSKNNGYIKTGEKTDVLISATFSNSKKDNNDNREADRASLEKLLIEINKDIHGYDSSIVGITLQVTPLEREAAKKYGISMGKYNLFLKAKDKGKDISIDQLNNIKVTELIDSIDDEVDNQSPNTDEDPLNTFEPVYTPSKEPIEEQTPKGELPKQTLTPKPEATPKLPQTVITDKITPTATLVPTPWVQNTKGNASKELKIKHYSNDNNALVKAIRWDFVIENTGDDIIDLKDVKVRYYFTEETDKTINLMSYFYSLGNEKTDFNGKVYKVSGLKEANRYLEITFNKGSVSPGETAWLFGALAREDWSEFNQKDDYSFNPEAKTFSDWNRMTAYISDKLVWGIEPK